MQRRARLGVIALAAVVLISAMCLALEQYKQHVFLRRMQKNGRISIYTFFSSVAVEPLKPVDLRVLPRSCGAGSFRTSTDFIRASQVLLVRRGIERRCSFESFGAPELGAPVCRSRDPSQFLSTNNAWCIVADLEEDDFGESVVDDAPYMFTKNLEVDSLAEIDAVLGRDSAMPQGGGVVVAQCNGVAIALTSKRQIKDYFGKLHMANVVLRP